MAAVIFALLTVSASAADTAHEEFSNILNGVIAERGPFDGQNGVIYSSLENFYYNTEMLLICGANGTVADCSVYAVNDGAECIDTLTLDMSGSGALLSVVIYDSMSYLTLEKNGETEYFAILDDSFTHVPKIEYSDKTEIVRFTDNKADVLSNSAGRLYGFLNSLRLETINSYTYMNKVNVVDSEFRESLIQFLSACANLTEFDLADYNYERVFKYVLYTHDAFEQITPFNPHSGESDGISSVNGEYIDYIMSEILNIRPEHPPFTDLAKRGFCYRDGVYLYTGGFSADFRTEIIDLTALHDLGNGKYHVVFSDIYYENGRNVPEYSYAILDNSDGVLSLLKLGMGKDLLTEHQISRYSSVSDMRRPAWERTDTESSDKSGTARRNTVIPVIIFISAAAAAALLYIILRGRRGK